MFLTDKAKCYVQGTSKIRSIGNGVAVYGSARLYVTGNPYIRAGASDLTGMFTHYGNGIVIASSTAKLSLKGGSIGTKATPDTALPSVVGTYYYATSANYPVLDMYGKALKQASGYKFIDPNGNEISIMQDSVNSTYPGLSPKIMLQTWTKSSDGYYTVYVKKK